MIDTIKKPWGYEYLLFQNEHVAIWHLFINAYQQTSLHSHPNKKTGLIVLDGAAKVSFLDGEHKLFYGEKIMIRTGVFHRTSSMTESPLHLFEVENPVNKNDIVRMEDSYGRSHSSEMGRSGFNVEPININNSTIGRCRIFRKTLDDKYFEEYKTEFDNFIITSGYIKYLNNNVAGPGDILSYKNLNKLVSKFQLNDQIEGIAIKAIPI